MPMRTKSLLAALVLAIGLAPCAGPALAGGDDPKQYQMYPLGVLDGTAEHLFGEDYLRLKTVTPGGPLDRAGLRPGDEIVGVRSDGEDKRFQPDDRNYMSGGTGPLRTLGEALDAAQGRPDGRIDLMARSGRREVTVPVKVAPIGSFSKDFPFNCPKSMRLYHASCDWLIAHLGEGGVGVQPALMGLALLCSRDPRHLAHTHKIAARVEAGLSGNLQGWNVHHAWAGIFLAEYNWRFRRSDPQGFMRRQRILQRLCNYFVTVQGRPDNKGHECAPGYDGVFFHGSSDRCYGGTGQNLAGTSVLFCWAICAKTNGIKLDQKAYDLTYDFIARRSTNGDSKTGMAVGYSRGGGLHDGQSNGRTGQAAQAMLFDGSPDALTRGFAMGKFLMEHSAQCREAHAITSLGIIPASAAIWRVGGPKAYRAHMDEWKWYLELMMQPDGHAQFIPGKANNGGDAYLGQETMANCIAAMMIAAPTRRLLMFGAGDPKDGFPGSPYGAEGDAGSGEYNINDGADAPEVDPLPIANLDKMVASIRGCRTQILDGRVSEALQRLDGMRHKNITAAEKAAVDQLTEYAYGQCLEPQLKAVDEALAAGDPLAAYRRYNLFKPAYPYAPRVKDRMAALEATFASPKTTALMDVGRTFERVLLQYQAKPEEYRAKMEAFVKANPGNTYCKNGQQALDAQAQNGAPKPEDGKDAPAAPAEESK